MIEQTSFEDRFVVNVQELRAAIKNINVEFNSVAQYFGVDDGSVRANGIAAVCKIDPIFRLSYELKQKKAYVTFLIGTDFFFLFVFEMKMTTQFKFSCMSK